MAIDFNNLLTPEQKRSLIEQRLAQFAAEAYQHELNRQVAAQLDQPELEAQSEKALGELEAAIVVHQTELDALPSE